MGGEGNAVELRAVSAAQIDEGEAVVVDIDAGMGAGDGLFFIDQDDVLIGTAADAQGAAADGIDALVSPLHEDERHEEPPGTRATGGSWIYSSRFKGRHPQENSAPLHWARSQRLVRNIRRDSMWL